MVSLVLAVLGSVVVAVGLIAITLSLLGMLRMPTIHLKLHALAVATSVGVTAVLLASLFTRNGEIITRAALVAMFVLITSPLSSHAIARAAHHDRLDDERHDRRDDGGRPRQQAAPADTDGG